MRKDPASIRRCPTISAIQRLLGGKWKLEIICYVGAAGVRRFGQLRELERDGFLLRRDFCQVPPHVEYTLTELGESFLPVMEEMTAWEETRLGTGRGAGGGKLAEKWQKSVDKPAYLRYNAPCVPKTAGGARPEILPRIANRH